MARDGADRVSADTRRPKTYNQYDNGSPCAGRADSASVVTATDFSTQDTHGVLDEPDPFAPAAFPAAGVDDDPFAPTEHNPGGKVTPADRLEDPELRLQRARDIAWAALNRREHTVAELERVLDRKRVEPEMTAAVIAELQEGGWLDDAGYAQRFAEDRRNLDGWGAERIARRLRSLGIDRELVDAAVAARDGADEMEAALELLRRRFPQPPDNPRDVQRALGVLVRKGYELELAHDALRRHAKVDEDF